MQPSREAGREGLRGPALKFLEEAARLGGEADRLDGPISLMDLQMLEIVRKLEGSTAPEETKRLVEEFEAATAKKAQLVEQQGALRRQERESYDKSKNWRDITKDLEGFAREAGVNSPS